MPCVKRRLIDSDVWVDKDSEDLAGRTEDEEIWMTTVSDAVLWATDIEEAIEDFRQNDRSLTKNMVVTYEYWCGVNAGQV